MTSSSKQLPSISVTSTSQTFDKCSTGDCVKEAVNDVHSVSVDSEFVQIGSQAFNRSELLNAFATVYEHNLEKPKSKFANPVPLGLSSFAFSCLILSLINAQVRGVTNNKIIIGAGLFYGGFIELVAGLLCYPSGDTFGMTVLGAYGGFWLSYASILTDAFGIISSYGDNVEMLNNALGFFLSGWTVFTFLMLMCTTKSHWGLFLCLLFLEISFILLTVGTFLDNKHVHIGGGYFGIFSSICAFYCLYCGVSSEKNSYLPLRTYSMPGASMV